MKKGICGRRITAFVAECGVTRNVMAYYAIHLSYAKPSKTALEQQGLEADQTGKAALIENKVQTMPPSIRY